MAEQTGRESRGARPGDTDQVDAAMAEIAAGTGALLHRYPRPGPAERQVVLRDYHDDEGSQFEAAVLEVDGALRVSGHDEGPRVSNFFGPGITSHEWVYVTRRPGSTTWSRPWAVTMMATCSPYWRPTTSNTAGTSTPC
jgi:hypothetical protein